MGRAQPGQTPKSPRQKIHAKGRAQDPSRAIPSIGWQSGRRQIGDNRIAYQPVFSGVKEMALPAQQTEPKARGHAERKKRHVNGRREEAVLVCFAQDDE